MSKIKKGSEEAKNRDGRDWGELAIKAAIIFGILAMVLWLPASILNRVAL